ncbi:MAG TPA: DUF4912 domain-containing protein [Anaeromyxobacter sp.]
MPDLKKMTLQSLRELARKKLGPRHSRLKTKNEIIEALEAEGAAGGGEAREPPARTPGARARAAGARAGEATAKAARAVKQAGKAASAGVRAAVRVGKAAAEGAAEGARAVRDAMREQKEGREPKAPARGAAKRGKLEKAAAAAAGAIEAARRERARPAEGLPDPEGHFVARVRGEDAVREAPHQMAETGGDAPWTGEGEGAGVPGYDEGLGELPWGYGDDAFIALPRDPTTVFLYWDLAGDTVARGFDGLDHGRAQLWVFAQAGEGWDRVRTVEFALESRGYYVHELEPGRTYRAEIHAVDRRGTDRLVGRSSNPVSLPPVGPSPVVDDRFARIPWDVPLGRLLGPGHPGGPFSDEARALLARLSDWGRFAGGTWGSAGGMGGRPFSPTSSPGGRPGPQGGEGR